MPPQQRALKGFSATSTLLTKHKGTNSGKYGSASALIWWVKSWTDTTVLSVMCSRATLYPSRHKLYMHHTVLLGDRAYFSIEICAKSSHFWEKKCGEKVCCFSGLYLSLLFMSSQQHWHQQVPSHPCLICWLVFFFLKINNLMKYVVSCIPDPSHLKSTLRAILYKLLQNLCSMSFPPNIWKLHNCFGKLMICSLVWLYLWFICWKYSGLRCCSISVQTNIPIDGN